MAKNYYCDHPYEPGDWLVIVGERRKQKHLSWDRRDPIPESYLRIPTPEDQGLTYVPEKSWFFRGKYWREDPPRSWATDREGIHFVMGLGMILPIPLLLMFIAWGLGRLVDGAGGMPAHYYWAIMAAWAVAFVVVTHVFLRYEETEDDDIHDRAYRDIGGYMVGLMVGGGLLTVVFSVLLILLGVPGCTVAADCYVGFVGG